MLKYNQCSVVRAFNQWLIKRVVLTGLLLSMASASYSACNANMPLSTPDSQFTDNGDSTVSDSSTGLMWAQCSEGLSDSSCATGTVTTDTWQDALALAEASTLAGHSDWRLPTIKELASLVEMACYSPAINGTFFPAMPSSYFWSASHNALYSYSVWVLNFGYGYDNGYNKNFNLSVRLVRGQ